MASFDLNTLARFPFINESGAYIKELKLSIDNILENVAYRTAWSRGKQRLQEALEYGEIRDHGNATEAENINELLSYVIARIIASTISDMYLIKRYALAEAVFAYHGLQEMDSKFISVVGAQFDLKPINIKDDELELNVIQFLKYSTAIRAPEYKLVNRDVQNGKIILSRRELARLIQEALRARIQQELPIDVDDDLKEKIHPKIKDLISLMNARKHKYEVQDLGKVSITRFPQCMKQLLGMTQAGENVPHVGRFALASFLHHIGLSSEQILTLFSTSPDFDVDKARYQVEHITGKISGTEYTPPGCDAMKSNSICFSPDELCKRDWMNHPLTYYRYKGKRKLKEHRKSVDTKQKEKESKN
jgi:DNA primase large subunit